jgi:hypothetical protein
MKRRDVVDFINDLISGTRPLVKPIELPLPQVRLPSYDGPYWGPVKQLTPEEYFKAKEQEKAQAAAKVLPAK